MIIEITESPIHLTIRIQSKGYLLISVCSSYRGILELKAEVRNVNMK